MELLLKKTLPNLGEIGEIINVAPGYARNFLIPKGYAEKLTADSLKRVESLKRKLEDEKSTQIENEKKMIKTLASRESFTIMAEADENGHLYGSVNETVISDSLKEEGFDIDKKNIIIEEPIKTCDIFNIEVKIGEETASIRLWVVAK